MDVDPSGMDPEGCRWQDEHRGAVRSIGLQVSSPKGLAQARDA